jgi:hypothetical protein
MIVRIRMANGNVKGMHFYNSIIAFEKGVVTPPYTQTSGQTVIEPDALQ